MDIRKLQRTVVDALEDIKAKDIQVFNTEHLSALFERVIIASAGSNRQTKALANSVKESVKAAGGELPRSEGEENGEWIIVDCGDVVVHIMQPVVRAYYRLEEIWGEKPVRLKLLADKASAAEKVKKTTKSGKTAAKSSDVSSKKTVAKKVVAKNATLKKTVTKKTVAGKTTAKKIVRKSV